MPRPIDLLSDAELQAINRKYEWVTATSDARGRILGRPSPSYVYAIPERRVIIARDSVGLKGKKVVEFGSLEGAHTVGLLACGADVIALEGRDSNIAKTKERCRLYGFEPKIQKCDVEKDEIPSADLFFHSGVLYHLQDPIAHLLRVMPLASEIVLDTHHTNNPTSAYVCATNGRSYPCWIYTEDVRGYKAGLRNFSRWVTLSALVETLKEAFSDVKVARDEIERNGPRATIVARGKR